jgi:hypothetical protein
MPLTDWPQPMASMQILFLALRTHLAGLAGPWIVERPREAYTRTLIAAAFRAKTK